jgi:hypothetical protein
MEKISLQDYLMMIAKRVEDASREGNKAEARRLLLVAAEELRDQALKLVEPQPQ